MADVPRIGRGARVGGHERQRIAGELAKRYNAGKSVRQLCAETGYSIGRMRRLLEEAGVEFRPRGGGHRRQR